MTSKAGESGSGEEDQTIGSEEGAVADEGVEVAGGTGTPSGVV